MSFIDRKIHNSVQFDQATGDLLRSLGKTETKKK